MTRLPCWIAVLGLLLAGCGGTDETEDTGEVARSDKQRVTAPQVAPTDLEAQVAGNNAFAFDLYQKVRTGQQDNVFYSPHSISIALAMLYAGARNNTEAQMASTLHYVLPQAKLHPVFNKLDLELASRGQGQEGADGGKFRLNIVNATWGQRDYTFLPGYLDTLALSYGAGLRLMDFASDPEGSRLAINQWVEQQTEDRIKDLLPQGSIESITRLVLTNAIYFNAAWAKKLEEEATKDGVFRGLTGQVTVPLMHGAMPGSHATGDGYQAAALPYDGHELSMLIVLPDEGKFDSVEQSLSAAFIDKVVADLQGAELDLTLPRFEIEHKLPLTEILPAMGMTDAFNDELADLSGINGKRDLYVTDVLHKAFVKVNEAGTEAAAATAVVVAPSAMPDYVTFRVDRPFIFLIRDHATGAILFVGRVLDPS